MKYILITGGTGFIGSHTSLLLLNKNYNIIIIDNLRNSKLEVIDNIKNLAKKSNIIFFNRDLSDNIDDIFSNYSIDSVIHFAGLKAVKESIDEPLLYYNTNIFSTTNLLKTMKKYHCKKLIFSSSATVYGNAQPPLIETMDIGIGITNPYGQTKFIIERILEDFSNINKNFNIIILRYFNPIGAHPSGLLGENPNDIPNNLMPYLLKVAYKTNIDNTLPGYDYLSVFGNDYNTHDGTCIRDYIHVMDLAESHILSIEKINNMEKNLNIFNIGLGKGTSVIELINIFERVNNIKLPYKIAEKRDGDLPIVYCDSNKSKIILGFSPKFSVEDMCRDSWNYKIRN